MFEVSVEHTFAAGHALRNYRGKCENVHGHNYRVKIGVRGRGLDHAGMLMDFTVLKRLLRDTSEILDHRFINEIPPFDTVNPTAENMALWFYEQLSPQLKASDGQEPVEIFEVHVWETDIQAAVYRPA